jgi:hypothetical protein
MPELEVRCTWIGTSGIKPREEPHRVAPVDRP